MNVAIVGAGIAGLSCAYALARHGAVRATLFEANDYFGGHTNTVDITIDTPAGPLTHGVDTGFLVFNHRTYPRLTALFEELGVETAPSAMSFSVALRGGAASGLEWAGTSLDAVFAQRRNLVRPAFLRMLADLIRFNRLCTALAVSGEEAKLNEPIGEFLARHRFSDEFRDWYFLPMIACIWSCPTAQMLAFPVGTMVRFCHNHGLLQVNDRPQWHTVRGGAREYVRRILAVLPDARRQAVRGVRRLASGKIEVSTDAGHEVFDHVVFACHSDEAIALLRDATPAERDIVGAVRYQPNRAVLHTDAALLPKRRKCWSAWNYTSRPDGDGQAEVCLHYLINQLQPLPAAFADTPVIVSLNPFEAPDPARVVREIRYSHPVFDLAAVAAQARLPGIQGLNRTWFCGAWTGYGFHEDGLRSGQQVAQRLLALAGAVTDEDLTGELIA